MRDLLGMFHNALVMLQLLLLQLAAPGSSCTEQVRCSLLRFLAGLSQDGGLAASWRPDVDCCRAWEGIACDGNGTIIEVSLPSRGLQGRILPSSLANQTGLTHLNLSHNKLFGGVPPELMYSSVSLLVLDVSYNDLDGVLPPSPSPPPPLTTGLKQPLQVLNISSNKFTAEFPSWNAMANLVTLNASNNRFTGQMPAAPLCRASPSLLVLDLSHNQFTGEVSPALANCSMLKVLKASRNKLSGALPVELFSLTSLEHISFANSGLQGELDGAHMAKLSNLVTLDLRGNNFHGEIPKSIGQLKKLEVLRLNNNNMSGHLPSSPTGGQMSAFPSSSFDGNPKLCGSMLAKNCDSVKAAPTIPTVSEDQQCSSKIISAIAFGAFFGIGVLYDQLVLFRYFG